ncbi:MAG: hypothetical protein K5695_09545 [Oscillospiraceae bacterium]|nr:hypothetical protein [Oscillospiraceae bacterium]
MSTILATQMIANAQNAVNTYVSTANGLFDNLETEVTSLKNNFSGDASDGYTEFFNSKIRPALTDNLTAPSSSLTANINSILDAIQQQLLNTVDPQLGEGNRGAGGGAGSGVSGAVGGAVGGIAGAVQAGIDAVTGAIGG